MTPSRKLSATASTSAAPTDPAPTASIEESPGAFEDAQDAVIPAETPSREEQIRIWAYAAAERRGFEPGFETDDWLEAERRFDEGSNSDASGSSTS